ncbi:MAG: hydroxyacylglutathione hydrolase [Pseudomonadota bacterium]
MTGNEALEVVLVPVLSDNYAFLIRDAETDEVAVVDPGEAAPVERALTERGWRPDWILLTHHHHDHIAGVETIAKAYGAKIAGAAADSARLPALDASLVAGEDWNFGAQLVEVIDTPGHTIGHIALYFPKGKALFAGDTLFSLGCGRLSEGTAIQMWSSLSKLMALPPETRVFCGHEYTLSNARFAVTVDPENAALKDRVAEVEAQRAANEPTIPTTLGREMATNPFLRAEEPSVKAATGLPDADGATTFAEIRRRKDSF